jgi:starch phosphorylase
MLRTLHTYTVIPSLPEKLQRLRELAYNLRWAWDHDTVSLFRLLDPDLWERTGHNPAQMLGMIPQERLVALNDDPGFLGQLEEVYFRFQRYMSEGGWFAREYGTEFGGKEPFRIAYFSAEFGITECLPIYSGGLGVLAGDHLKSASDLGLPLVGVGFLYQRGYFRQSLNADGWQIEHYPNTDFYSLPIEPALDPLGKPYVIGVNFPGRVVWAQVWRAQVGRIPLFLLDTNLPQNSEADRHIAGNLYGGDLETRIQQEIVLGIGGIHALAEMGIHPTVCHMNEGHSAFLALERVRRLVQEKKISYDEAAEVAGAGSLFTTHTPVPAGFDIFPPDLMRRYFGGYAGELGISFDELLDKGRVRPGDAGENFNMAALALRHARYINGVSKLHGEVTRRMVQPAWPGFPETEVPVASVTNGIHKRSFLSAEMAELLDRYLGLARAELTTDPKLWERVDQIPDEELWRTHERRRERLVSFARRHVVSKLQGRGASEGEVRSAREILSPNVLTIGFARRFATYKRGNLLLRDPERLKRLLNNPERPVQFVFAGKAHPRDDAGKELIRQIVHFARGEDVRRRMVFLEDYDMAMARSLVQGVDVWLNNPRRPMEASGTSGMKVLANGGLNFSILDGWWAEAYTPEVGWAIGRGEDYTDLAYQDHVEAEALYTTLEREIIPLFYDRDRDNLPRGWIAKMKASMKQLAPVFSTARMVREYAENFYIPAARRYRDLAQDDLIRAKALVAWKRKLRDHWGEVRVERVNNGFDKAPVGQPIPVSVTVRLGQSLTPQDVAVQLYTGPVDADRRLVAAEIVPLALHEAQGDQATYTGALPSGRTGQHGFTVRVVPFHPDAVLPQELPLITWE